MTTLNELIDTIDQRILKAESLSDSSAAKTHLPGEQERMRKYVLIRIGKDHLAIPIDGLAEVGPSPDVTMLPNLPPWLLGIVNLRGEIISVVDLQLLLGLPSEGYGFRGKLAVLQARTMSVGIRIDQVVATVSRPESDKVPIGESDFCRVEPGVFSDGLMVDDQVYHILYPDRFMDMERLMRYYAAA